MIIRFSLHNIPARITQSYTITPLVPQSYTINPLVPACFILHDNNTKGPWKTWPNMNMIRFQAVRLAVPKRTLPTGSQPGLQWIGQRQGMQKPMAMVGGRLILRGSHHSNNFSKPSFLPRSVCRSNHVSPTLSC